MVVIIILEFFRNFLRDFLEENFLKINFILGNSVLELIILNFLSKFNLINLLVICVFKELFGIVINNFLYLVVINVESIVFVFLVLVGIIIVVMLFGIFKWFKIEYKVLICGLCSFFLFVFIFFLIKLNVLF